MLAECHASKKRKIYWQIFICKRKEKLLTKCHTSKKGKTADTARKIKFPKSWNIMKIQKYQEISIFRQLFRSKKDRISYVWKVQNKNFFVLKKHGILYWRKYHLKSTFWIKRMPYLPSPKSSKHDLFRIQKTWYSMLKKISSYINFLNQKKTVFPISEKFKRRNFA